MTMRRFLRALSLLPVGLLAGACYSYVPVAQPTPGTTVRIHVPLTSAASAPNRAPETLDVEGTVLSAGDTLVMVTETRRELGQFRVVSQTDTLRMARTGILSVEEQVFSKPKTFGLTALVTGGAVTLVLLALDAAGGQAGDGNGGDPPIGGALRIPPLIFQQLWSVLIR